jgi:hypothetical protein
MNWRAFFHGFGSVLDLSGSSFTSSLPARYHRLPESDAEAIRSDWDAVGEDFKQVFGDLDRAERRVLQRR